jgi:hypothetical protein
MDPSIEKNAVALQKKTTHVIVEQKVILAKRNIDGLLDEVLVLQKHMQGLAKDAANFIDTTVSYINQNENNESYIFVHELIIPVSQIIERLLKSIKASGKLEECFREFVDPFEILLSDVDEIIDDLRYKIEGDQEMNELLSSL